MKSQIYLGDCLEILPKLQAKSVDLVLFDPPYGYAAKKRGQNKWDLPINLDLLFSQFDRLLAPNGLILCFASGVLIADVINAYRKYYRYDLIWEKPNATGFLNAHKIPLRAHESILVFYKTLPVYNPVMTAGEPYFVNTPTESLNYRKFSPGYQRKENFGTRFPRSVVTFGRTKGLNHPTAKPIELLEYLITTFTDKDSVVLDCCAGSFSTGLASMRLGRSFIGIEKDQNFYDAGILRLIAESKNCIW